MVVAEGHIPVMAREVVEFLAPGPGKRLLDGTFGGGGHTRLLLEGGAEVTAFDQDPEAVSRAASLSAVYGDRFRFVGANFACLGEEVTGNFDGMLFDLGVSSYQLDEAERGFSFRRSGPTDMRMNPAEGLSAREFLETADRRELVRAVRDLGEETRWRRVVEALLRERGSGQLGRTDGLAAVVTEALGPGAAGSRLHPATKVFQGIRMAVNRELEVLEAMLPEAFALLAKGGVLAVISFHSLEDRIVKRTFRRWSGRPESAWDHRPQQEREVFGTDLTPRPLTPGESEIAANPRSRSAKLRVFRKEVG